MYQQIQILYQAYDKFNQSKFNNKLPKPIITVQSQKLIKKTENGTLGWCSMKPIWTGEKEYHEINITAEYLNRPFYDIAGTLLHEMVHLSNQIKGIEDCSKKQYHNEKFKEEAERIGLSVEKIKQHGYAVTRVTKTITDEIDLWNDINKSVFNVCRINDNSKKNNSPRAKKIKYQCLGCKKVIWSDLEDISVACLDCKNLFQKV
jgi:hypothetical protein